jgi:hypothetical protein
MVVDPCYVDNDSDLRGMRSTEWRDPLDDEYTRAYTEHDYIARAEVRDGVVFTTQLGDGVYPVEAVLDDRGILLRVEILIGQRRPEDTSNDAEPPVLGEGAPMDELVKLAEEIFGPEMLDDEGQ